jgi:uncharacterized protein
MRNLIIAGAFVVALAPCGPYDLLAENASWTIVGRSAASRTYESREAFMRDVIRPFNARMSARCDRRFETCMPMAMR